MAPAGTCSLILGASGGGLLRPALWLRAPGDGCIPSVPRGLPVAPRLRAGGLHPSCSAPPPRGLSSRPLPLPRPPQPWRGSGWARSSLSSSPGSPRSLCPRRERSRPAGGQEIAAAARWEARPLLVQGSAVTRCRRGRGGRACAPGVSQQVTIPFLLPKPSCLGELRYRGARRSPGCRNAPGGVGGVQPPSSSQAG